MTAYRSDLVRDHAESRVIANTVEAADQVLGFDDGLVTASFSTAAFLLYVEPRRASSTNVFLKWEQP